MYWCAPEAMVRSWINDRATEKHVTTGFGKQVQFDDTLELGSKKRLNCWNRLRAEKAMESVAELHASGEELGSTEGLHEACSYCFFVLLFLFLLLGYCFALAVSSIFVFCWRRSSRCFRSSL